MNGIRGSKNKIKHRKHSIFRAAAADRPPSSNGPANFGGPRKWSGRVRTSVALEAWGWVFYIHFFGVVGVRNFKQIFTEPKLFGQMQMLDAHPEAA